MQVENFKIIGNTITGKVSGRFAKVEMVDGTAMKTTAGERVTLGTPAKEGPFDRFLIEAFKLATPAKFNPLDALSELSAKHGLVITVAAGAPVVYKTRTITPVQVRAGVNVAQMELVYWPTRGTYALEA